MKAGVRKPSAEKIKFALPFLKNICYYNTKKAQSYLHSFYGSIFFSVLSLSSFIYYSAFLSGFIIIHIHFHYDSSLLYREPPVFASCCFRQALLSRFSAAAVRRRKGRRCSQRSGAPASLAYGGFSRRRRRTAGRGFRALLRTDYNKRYK